MTERIIHCVKRGRLYTYKVVGECNFCGDCCVGPKQSIDFRVRVFTTTTIEQYEDKTFWPNWSGWNVLKSQDLWWYFKSEIGPPRPRCNFNDPETHKCALWDDVERLPAQCRYWPFRPSDLAGYPNCSLQFERVEEIKDEEHE